MDDESGLEDLIAQRKSRPAFARMISWEIDNSGAASGKRRREISTASTESESLSEDEETAQNSEDSEDSEYYSAGEDMLSEDSKDSPSNYTSADQQSETTEQSASVSITTDEMKSDFDSLDIGSIPSDKHKSLSKKQKRRRRDKLKNSFIIAYADYEVPFRHVEDIDIEVSDLVGFSDDLSRSCTRTVPTLFELCVQTISTKRPNKPRQSTSDLPKIMKHVLSEKRRDQSFTSAQLSWLYRLLGYAEENLYVNFVKRSEDNHDNSGQVKFQTRSIWNNSYSDQSSSASSDILLYSYLYYEYEDYMSMDWRYPFCLLAVVASVIDLMLPRQLSSGRLRHASHDSSTESELIHKTTDAIVYSVKQILKQRYPGVVQYFFDTAIPYVFWARGNLKFAAEAFVRLAQAKEGKERAMFLNEAARLYAQNEESNKAQRLYMEASGAIITRATQLKHDHDVKIQQFMLMASVYDQGVMTLEKTRTAAEAWVAAMKFLDPKCPWTTATRAVESFLCLHSGSSEEPGSAKERLVKAGTLIESLCKHCDLLFLYLSLVKALLGEGQKSYHAYRTFTSSATAAMFELVRTESGVTTRRLTPWQQLIDHEKLHGTPDLLKVIWRTQLGHLRVVNNMKLFEADMQAKTDLNLRLTENGFLTADLQMMLPPIRALNLDPYTGLHLHNSGQTHEWHSLSHMDISTASNASGYFLVPTLSELYHDDCGNRIHIYSPDSSLIMNASKMSKQVTLFWTGADGLRAKLNLIPFLKDALKQHTLDLINLEVKKNPSPAKDQRGSPTWVEKTRLCTEYCHKKGYAMGIRACELVSRDPYLWNLVLKFSQPKHKKGKATKKEKKAAKEKMLKDKVKKPQSAKYEVQTFAVELEEYYQYKDTLYLCFYHNAGSNKRIHVFIDCTSKADFLDPVVTMEGTQDCMGPMNNEAMISSIPRNQSLCKQPVVADEIMWQRGHLASISEHVYKVYGKKGEVLKTVSLELSFANPYVMRRKLYGISPDKLRVSCDDLRDNVIMSDELPKISSLVFGGGKVVCVTESAIYFLDADTLSALTIKQHSASTHVEVSENGCSIKCSEDVKVQVLEQKRVDGEGKIRVAVGVGSMLMFVDVKDDDVEVVLDIMLAGNPREVCTVNQQVGFLVSATIFAEGQNFYRENLYYYRHDGRLQGVLLFLGPGPRCFCVKYLTGSGEGGDSGLGEKGWYVFMRDGHEGIIGVKLS